MQLQACAFRFLPTRHNSPVTMSPAAAPCFRSGRGREIMTGRRSAISSCCASAGWVPTASPCWASSASSHGRESPGSGPAVGEQGRTDWVSARRLCGLWRKEQSRRSAERSRTKIDMDGEGGGQKKNRRTCSLELPNHRQALHTFSRGMSADRRNSSVACLAAVVCEASVRCSHCVSHGQDAQKRSQSMPSTEISSSQPRASRLTHASKRAHAQTYPCPSSASPAGP